MKINEKEEEKKKRKTIYSSLKWNKMLYGVFTWWITTFFEFYLTLHRTTAQCTGLGDGRENGNLMFENASYTASKVIALFPRTMAERWLELEGIVWTHPCAHRITNKQCNFTPFILIVIRCMAGVAFFYYQFHHPSFIYSTPSIPSRINNFLRVLYNLIWYNIICNLTLCKCLWVINHPI